METINGRRDHAAAAQRRRYIAEHAETQYLEDIAAELGMTPNSVRKVAQRMHIHVRTGLPRKTQTRKPRTTKPREYMLAAAPRVEEHTDRSQLDCMPNPFTGRNCRVDW